MAKPKISLIRRILNWIGLIIVLILLIGVWAAWEQSKYEDIATPYVRQAVSQITEWDPDVVWDLYSPEVRETISREYNERVVKGLARLGRLEELGMPRFLQVKSSATIRTGTLKLVYFEVPVIFESGDASISVALKDDDGDFSVYSFNINSMAFLE